MPTSTLVNDVKTYTLNVGTGPLILGGAVAAHRGVEALIDGATYSYSIDQSPDYEFGRGVYAASGHTLTRGVIKSSNANAEIVLLSGSSVGVVLLAEDLEERVGIPANLTVGTVTAGAPGSDPIVVITPNPASPNFRVDYTIPRGADGGVANFTIGSVTTLPYTEPAYVTLTGAFPDLAFNFGIPQGVPGAPAFVPSLRFNDARNSMYL